MYQSLSSEIESRNVIGKDLGVDIPYWGTSFNSFDNTVTIFSNEGKINASLEFSDKSANILTDQIVHSKYFSQKQLELYYTDGNNWPEQDSIKYWTVRNYLKKRKSLAYGYITVKKPFTIFMSPV